jgi:hypothetical protein
MDFQYRTFWIQACRLFFERQVVCCVSLERRGIRAFDDVVTDYRSPIYDAHNRLIEHDHFQNKVPRRLRAGHQGGRPDRAAVHRWNQPLAS